MSEVRWHPIEHSAYAAIWASLDGETGLSIFGTHTCMDGCEWHSEPNILTEWGFKGADYPLVKSHMRGERGTPQERWDYFIAEPIKEGALEAEVAEMTSVLALLRLHRTRHPDEPIPSELLNREYGLLCDQGDPELEAKEGP